jgi:hypothetical protein
MRVRSSDATIRGHLLCSFLAPFMWKLLGDLMRDAGGKLEWRKLLRDLDRLSQVRSAVAAPTDWRTATPRRRWRCCSNTPTTRCRPHVRSVPGHPPNPNLPEDVAAAQTHATPI